MQLWSSKACFSLITLHTLYHPPSSLFHLRYNQFNPTCFGSHRNRICQLRSDFEIVLPAALVLAALSTACCGPCQAPLFSATCPPPKPGLASWATSAIRNPPSALQHQEPKHALLQNPSTPVDGISSANRTLQLFGQASALIWTRSRLLDKKCRLHHIQLPTASKGTRPETYYPNTFIANECL